jgi:hypothetical protein
MSKKNKTPKQDRHTEPRLPPHDYSGSDNPAEDGSVAAENMRNDPDNPLPRDPATTRTDSGDMDTREGKAVRHPASGRYIAGPQVPDMPANHDVTAFDLNSDAQAVTMRRSTAPSMPNAMPAGPDVRPAVNVLDMSTLSELCE